MNSRERARKTLNHREADRPAIDLGATRMTCASGWTYQALKRALGIESDTLQLVFWGGAISTQRTFPFGSPEDVAREARQVLDVLSPGGGYVVNPTHNILPEVPVENIVALYRTAREYRY